MEGFLIAAELFECSIRSQLSRRWFPRTHRHRLQLFVPGKEVAVEGCSSTGRAASVQMAAEEEKGILVGARATPGGAQ